MHMIYFVLLTGRICGGRSTSHFSVTLTDSLNAKEALCFMIEGQAYNNQMMGISS